jgi:uncharacterized small protein (DUF1192 family)
MKRKGIVLALGSLLLLGGGVWAVVRHARPDRQMTHVKDLRGKINAETRPEERRQLWQEYQKEAAKLSIDQQKQLRQEQAKAFNERIDKYFALQTQEERIAYLDAEIDRREANRQKRAADPSAAGGPPGAPGRGGFAKGTGPGGPTGTTGARGGSDPAKAGPDGTTQTAGADPANPATSPTADSRETMRKLMLDLSTPQERAQRAEYFQQLRARQQQRGQPTTGRG